MIAAGDAEGVGSDEHLAGLVARISWANSAAFGDFYDRTATLAFSVAFRILSNASDAADVVQETFIAVWTKSATFDAARGSPVAWLISICRHKAINRWRQRCRQERLLGAHGRQEETESDGFTVPDCSAGIEARHIRAAVAALAPRDRAVLELAYFGGYTHLEIAGRLQEPAGTVKARIRRALFKLRRELAEFHSEVR